ncbi:DUF2971 domain-containing protein [Pelosinus sp. sgz500959]|uniref:DUF2971 domain-containing protein n=1 Tax=Pelosinus sp. sgz500959 TaxID=3242472 RepID=UPI00366F4DAE
MGDEKPRHLYKYCHWNKYARKILWNNELYLNSAKNFNDPFDSCIMFNLKGSNDEWFRATIDMIAELSKRKLTQEEKEEWKKKIYFADTDELKDSRREFVEQLVMGKTRTNSGICCFSKEKDNILMWSHYAKDHTGICLEFDYSNPAFPPVRKVIYEENYPPINIVDINNKEKITDLYFTKSKDWEYENEYRISNVDVINDTIEFDPQILTGVICGEAMKEKDVKQLIRFLSCRSTPLTLYKAERKKYQFGLDIEEIGRFNYI